jgi:hypothetical protein
MFPWGIIIAVVMKAAAINSCTPDMFSFTAR